MNAKLTLSRKVGWARRTWPISIDGNVSGFIGPGATVDLEIEPGEHTLRLGTPRYRSPDRSFLVAEGGAIRFRCHSRYTLGGILFGLVKPDFLIALHQQ